ncbi:MAG: ATP-binding cassette domain-containing protein [Solirubrobacterales bacterium]|nr:ATP-binding cassette domain-containing protein [Solirubrobacterales bacterium]
MSLTDSPDIAIKASGLTKSFGETKAVVGVDLEVQRGTVTAILGPNGAGKTTVVRMLTTLLKIDGGAASVGGVDVAKDPNAARRKIGLTGQDTAVDELLTGRENLVLIARLARLDKDDATARADVLLDRFDLMDAADRNAGTYSGGMRRRLDLAASMIADPEILFLDEPTTGLDPRSRISIWEKIEELVEAGTTVLLTTQYLEEADQLADDIIVIDHGIVIARGTSDELKDQVGGQRLEFKVSGEGALDRAADKLAAQNVEVVDRDDREHRITVALTDGAIQIARLIDSLDFEGVKIEEVFVHRPTLDDVFLTLTGTHVESDESTEES